MEEMSEQDHLDGSKYDEEPAHEQQQHHDESDLFWAILQTELNEEIPKYVKNVLRLCRLDKPLTFRCIRDETIDEAEKFARKDMKYQLMGVEVNLEDYYGPYHRAPSKFRFAIGDRFLLKQLVACAKSKSDDYWQRALARPSHATPTSTLTRYVSLNETQQQQQQQHDSELELSDEEDRLQPDEPPNLEHERRKLADMVRSTLMKEEYAGDEDPQRVAARVKVRVEMRPMQEADGTTRDVVTGYIKCVFCATKLMIRKQCFGTRKPRWVISNYRRHIRFHLEGKLKKPGGQELVEQQRRSTRCKTEHVDEEVNETEEHEAEERHEAEEHEMEETYAS